MPVYMDDKRLAKDLLSGRQKAFDRFFDEHFARLYRFAVARLGGNEEAAREVVQSTLFKGLRNMSKYRGEAAMFTWLCAICRNELSDWFTRDNRYRARIVFIEDLPEVAAAIDSVHAPESENPERQYQREEAVRLIQVALDRLPANYGNVLEWKYVEGYSVQEIAARLDVGTEAAQSLLARAKRAFADVYTTLRGALNENQGLMSR